MYRLSLKSLVLNREFRLQHFDTNLKHKRKDRSRFPLKGDGERKREGSAAFPLYISQRCSTEFLPTVRTHKAASVPPWKRWHHDWDGSVTWPVQQILDCFPYQYCGVPDSDSTLQIKCLESHCVNSTQASSWQQIYGQCFPYIIIDHIFYQLRYWSWEWLKASLDWLRWKERLHKFFFSQSSVK